VSSSVRIVTGHDDPHSQPASGGETLVILMGVANIGSIARRLVAEGRTPATPTAVVQSGTTPAQQVVTGTLGDIADRCVAARVKSPAVIVVGGVAALAKAVCLHERIA
jgi:siroheme synthase